MESATKANEAVQLDSLDLPSLAAKAKDWAYLNGLVLVHWLVYEAKRFLQVMRNRQESSVIHAPIAVLPCPFPKSSFQKAVEVMPLMNRLYDNVSRDAEFLTTTLKSAAELDDFTANLLSIYGDVRELQDGSEEVVLGIHRSDYMLDQPSNRLLQVLKRFLMSEGKFQISWFAGRAEYDCFILWGAQQSGDEVPHMSSIAARYGIICKGSGEMTDNQACSEISRALATAHDAMRLTDSSMLMVAEHNDGNLYDQQWITLTLLEKHGIAVTRKSLAEIMDCSVLDGNGNLIVDGKLISVVYYRSGYGPSFYPTQREWEARRRIEISSACKCPSISYHLTGTKKIQQELAKPGRLENYLNVDECKRVREFFAGLWGLEDLSDPDVQTIIQEAIQHPDRFVLKPQREGGGNNLYGMESKAREFYLRCLSVKGEDAVAVLSKRTGLAAYVLMQRIQPAKHRSLLLRNEEHFIEDTVSELGIYGTFLRRGTEILLNASAGHLLRTKVASSDEGGVAAGFAVLDSPYLTDP